MTRLIGRAAWTLLIVGVLVIGAIKTVGALIPEADSLVFLRVNAQEQFIYVQLELSRRLTAPMMAYTDALDRCRRHSPPYTAPPDTFEYARAPHWALASPDQRYVAVGVESAIFPSEMHLLDARGRFLWAFPLEARLYGWLSDSETMVVIAQNPPQQEYHYLRAADGLGVRFAPTTRRDGQPSRDDLLTLSPDHTRLVFGSDRDSAASGLLDLYLLNFADGAITRLTTHSVSGGGAVWCVGG